MEKQRAAQAEDALIVERDRSNKDPHNGGLFRGCFKLLPTRQTVIIDHEDGVARCPNCTWELEEGWCNGCEEAFEVADDGASFTNVSDTSSSYDSEDAEIYHEEVDEPRITYRGVFPYPTVPRNQLNNSHARALVERNRTTPAFVGFADLDTHHAISISSNASSAFSEDEQDTDLEGFIEDDHTDINAEDHEDGIDSDSSSGSRFVAPFYGDGQRVGTYTDDSDENDVSDDDDDDDNTTIRSGASRSDGEIETDNDDTSHVDEEFRGNELCDQASASEHELASDNSSVSEFEEPRASRKRRRIISDDDSGDDEEDEEIMDRRSRPRFLFQEGYASRTPVHYAD